MKMKKEWLLDDIAGMKKFIDKNDGETDLMIHATRGLLPLLEDDPEIEIDRKPGENNDHLYIRHGKNVNGKYRLKINYIY